MITPKQLRRIVAGFEPEQPLTVEFEKALRETTASLRRAWYRDQKEHWLKWLGEYDGPGAYGRKTWDVSARVVYNRVVNPAMVLWLGEAAGLPSARVRAAIQAAKVVGGSFARQAGAIRAVIPWEDVEAQLTDATTRRSRAPLSKGSN